MSRPSRALVSHRPVIVCLSLIRAALSSHTGLQRCFKAPSQCPQGIRAGSCVVESHRLFICWYVTFSAPIMLLESFNDSLLETGQSSNNMVLILTHSIPTGSNLGADFGVSFAVKMPNLLCLLCTPAVGHKRCRQEKLYGWDFSWKADSSACNVQCAMCKVFGIFVHKGAKISSLMKHLMTHGIQLKAEGCTMFDSLYWLCANHINRQRGRSWPHWCGDSWWWLLCKRHFHRLA